MQVISSRHQGPMPKYFLMFRKQACLRMRLAYIANLYMNFLLKSLFYFNKNHVTEYNLFSSPSLHPRSYYIMRDSWYIVCSSGSLISGDPPQSHLTCAGNYSFPCPQLLVQSMYNWLLAFI